MASDGPVLSSALRELAADFGIGLEYVDGRGDVRRATSDVRFSVINALDDSGSVRTSADARTKLRDRRRDRAARIVEPVYVVDEGVVSSVPISLVRKGATLECRIEFEFGAEVSWSVGAETLTPHADPQSNDGGALVGLVLPVMRVGYHRLHLGVGRRSVSSTIIVRPLRGARGRFAKAARAAPMRKGGYPAKKAKASVRASHAGRLEKRRTAGIMESTAR